MKRKPYFYIRYTWWDIIDLNQVRKDLETRFARAHRTDIRELAKNFPLIGAYGEEYKALRRKAI